jgi:hypothetical protein
MRRYLLLMPFYFACAISIAQTVEVLKSNPSVKSVRYTRFEFLDKKVDASGLLFIGSIKAIGKDKKASISKLYFKLKDQAYLMGANSFKVNAYSKNEKLKEAALTLDLYKANDSLLNAEKANRKKNTIFVFLNDFFENETYTFSISDVDKEIKSSTYVRYELKPKEVAAIETGGLLSASFTFKWKAENPSTFLTLTDFGQEKASDDYDYSGRYFNTKRINGVESSLGWLLVSIFKSQ